MFDTGKLYHVIAGEMGNLLKSILVTGIKQENEE